MHWRSRVRRRVRICRPARARRSSFSSIAPYATSRRADWPLPARARACFRGSRASWLSTTRRTPKSAAIIAAYLKSVGGAAPAAHTKHRRNAAKPHKPAAENSTKTAKKTGDKKADKSSDKKSENADKTKGETTAKPEDGKAKAEEPAVAKPKPAAMAADKKKPASPSTQAKDGKSVAGDKKAD